MLGDEYVSQAHHCQILLANTPKKLVPDAQTVGVKVVMRGRGDGDRDAMKAKIQTEDGDAIYRARKGQVQPAFGSG